MSETNPEAETTAFYIEAHKRAAAVRRLRARETQHRRQMAATRARAGLAAMLAAGRPR